MDHPIASLSGAAALAPPAAPGHYDELRGIAAPGPTTADHHGKARHGPAPPWARFFEQLGAAGPEDLDRRLASLQRQIRDNGVTSNVYADRESPQRPWSLDLFPLIVTPASWREIEAGVLQRVRLLDRVLADVYGPQRLLAANLLPPALVHGHPGYLRAMHGVEPAGGTFLHIAAFDLARDPRGHWWVLSQRTQAPSGLGYLLENRTAISRLFPDAFRELKVQRLAGTYRTFVEGLRSMAPAADEPRIVLLTPGPHHETSFEHASLARFLGLPLVEGDDLTVRDERLYLKTLRGLEPVHVVLRRLDDEFLDPLELRADSRLGVPGLLEAVRAGNVLIANAPGSGFLESPGVMGFLPALARELLGEALKLPSLASWWCGERAALDAVLPQLADGAIRPTCGGAGAVLVRGLPARERQAWVERLRADPDRYTVQAWLPPAQMPTWRRDGDDHRIQPRSFVLRVFAVSQGPGSWQVLPGGLTRIAAADGEIATVQRGDSSADTWVLTGAEADHGAPPAQPMAATRHGSHSTTSRAAESLFWMGRYTERSENTARLARLALECLTGEERSARPLLAWLGDLAVANGLVDAKAPPPLQARRGFERALVAGIGDARHLGSIAFNLQALQRAASAVRERLSQDQWNVILRAQQQLRDGWAALAASGQPSPLEALRLLAAVSQATAAMSGSQTDRMTRDDGWQLLSAGRHVERLGFLAGALLAAANAQTLRDAAGFEAVLALFGSTITCDAQHQERHDLAAVVELLVLDHGNQRALGWVVRSLRADLDRLAGRLGAGPSLASGLPDAAHWPPPAQLGAMDSAGRPAALIALLQACVNAAWRLSDALTARYFTHSEGERHTVGA